MLYRINNNLFLGESIENLVYVVGSPRSGTSVIFEAIDLSDDIYCLPGMSHYYSNVWRPGKALHPRLLKIIHSLPRWYDVDSAISNLQGGSEKDIQKYIIGAYKKRDFKKLYVAYPLVSSLIRKDYRIQNLSSAWCDKSNDWRGLRKIKLAFPGAKYVFVLRDPRSVVLSSSKRAAMKDGKPGISDGYVVTESLAWLWMAAQLLFFKRKYPDNCHIVKYEDFVKSPIVTLNNIFLFITGKKCGGSDLSLRLASLSGAPSNSEGRVNYEGVSKEPLERWKNELSAHHISLIEAICYRVMMAESVGYKNRMGTKYGFISLMRAFSSIRQQLKYALAIAVHLASFSK